MNVSVPDTLLHLYIALTDDNKCIYTRTKILPTEPLSLCCLCLVLELGLELYNFEENFQENVKSEIKCHICDTGAIKVNHG